MKLSSTLHQLRLSCYHIYSSQATIFYFSDTIHFSARSLTYEMLRWAVLMDHYYISGLLHSPMSTLSLRTLRFEDRCSHLCHYRAVIDAQFYISSFSLDRWCLRWIILHDYDSAFYIVLWLLLLLYWFLWHVLTCGIMIAWSGNHDYMDLVVSCTMYWCPHLHLEVLDLYSLVLPSLGRTEVVIPTIVLAC